MRLGEALKKNRVHEPVEPPYRLPAGPKGLPGFGNVFAFSRDPLCFLSDVQREFGRMATISIGRTPVVLLFEPADVRYVLVENPRNFTSREVAGGLVFGKLMLFSLLNRAMAAKAISSLGKLVGDGLITTDGTWHEHQRRTLHAAFTKRRVDAFSETIVRYAVEMTDKLRCTESIDLAEEMRRLILRVIMKLLIDLDVQDPLEMADYVRIIDGMMSQPVSFLEGLTNLPFELPFTSFRRRMTARREADQYIYRFIERRLSEGRRADDVLSVLLSATDEQQKPLTRQQIRDELVSLMAAGHETTTNTLVWTLYLIASHPRVLARVQAELDSVLDCRKPQLADLPKLVYLDQVIRESMRLYPSGWVLGRRAINDFELDGYRFPAGTLLMFNQWVIHRRPDLWQQPERFLPERWDPVTGRTPASWSYFPFGGGPRMCMAKSLAELEVLLTLSVLLQRFSIRIAPRDTPEPLPLITLRSRNGLRARLEPRQSLAPSTAAPSAARDLTAGCPVRVGEANEES